MQLYVHLSCIQNLHVIEQWVLEETFHFSLFTIITETNRVRGRAPKCI